VAAFARFLVVRLSGREFAIPAGRICGMLQMRGLEVQPMSGLGSLRYLTAMHGRALPIFVPNEDLGLKVQPVSARTCLVLLNTSTREAALDASRADCAMAVDSISRLEDLPASHCRLPHQVRIGDKWRDVLDVDRLCRPRAFVDNSRIA